MTWFRCGGGGIPASLKNGMNAVLNKKFGTSGQTYAPSDWPDDVNLLGKLPEKTVSGSIAHITDGADEVPIKSWDVEIAPTLTGKSAIECTQSGKNLVNIPDSAEITRNQLNSNVVPLLDDILNGKKGNFTISAKTAETVENANFMTIRINYTDGSSSSNIYIYRGSTHTSGGITGTFSISSDPTKIIDSIYFGGNTGAAKCAISEWQIEANSQATTYEPYTAPTTHTVQLGRTIYGGTADVVKGEGTDDRLRYDLDENDDWGVYGGADHSYWHNVATGEDRPIDVTKLMESICNHLTVSSSPIASAPDFTFGIQGGQRIVVTADSSINTLDKFKTWLETHPLEFVIASANPSTFTFTPITPTPETALGTNNFWADTGDSSVTYRGQGTITPILPTLISKSITQNGTYSAEDDGADGYDEVTVNVSGGSCERLLYLHCVNNDQIEIPAASSITQGAKYSQYVSYDSTTKKFTVLQDFTAIIIAWVYTYQTYESSRSDGAIYINNSQVAQYEASGTAAGSTGGVYLARNFKQNDTFNVYTPTRDGYPQQNLKIYLLADVPDNIYTFTDENA